MKDIQENSGKIGETPRGNYTFPDYTREMGKTLPVYTFLFDLLQENKITPKEVTLFIVLMNHSFFTTRGMTRFPLSNPEIQKKTGLSENTVKNSLRALSALGVIRLIMARNGLKTEIEINFERIKELNTPSKFDRDPIKN